MKSQFDKDMWVDAVQLWCVHERRFIFWSSSPI